MVIRASEHYHDITGLPIPSVAKKHRPGSRPWSDPGANIDWTLTNRVKVGEYPEKAKKLFLEINCGRYRDFSKIFTDGSVADEQVGFGISTDNEQVSGRLPNGCSIFTAEAYAIVKALQLVPENSPTVVYSDSASCLMAVDHGTSSHPWIQQIEILARDKNTTLCWVPAHVGIAGNEKADRLAATGRLGAELITPIPAMDAKKIVKQYIRYSWEGEWRNSNESFLRRVKGTTIRWLDRKCSKERRAITRLRIGHTNISHRTIFSRDSNICDACGEEVTVIHILANCRKYETERIEAQLDADISNILSNDEANEEKISTFLKKCQLLDRI